MHALSTAIGDAMGSHQVLDVRPHKQTFLASSHDA